MQYYNYYTILIIILYYNHSNTIINNTQIFRHDKNIFPTLKRIQYLFQDTNDTIRAKYCQTSV